MESVTEQLRRSGLIIDEMDNPEQSTNNLTPQQAKIVFDSIPRLMDMDSIMSSNTENPIVFPFVSMCIFSDLFPGEKERKRQVSSEIAHHGRRLMEITIHDLSPRQKGFIINTAFSGLLSSPRLQLDAARELFENNQDQAIKYFFLQAFLENMDLDDRDGHEKTKYIQNLKYLFYN